MDAIPLRDDNANIKVECFISGQALNWDSMSEHENKSDEQSTLLSKQQAQRKRLASRMPSSLRISSRDLFESFDQSLTMPDGERKDMSGSGAGFISSISASNAQLVAAEYFAEGHGQGDDGFDESSTAPSLLDDRDDNSANRNSAYTKKDTETTCSESRISEPSPEDVLALEVGNSANEYLEECFYTEVSVLNRKKFNSIPEIVKSDLKVTGYLGKGSYNDVFEVTFKDDRQFGAKMINAITGDDTKLLRRRPSRARRATSALSSSITVATLSRPTPCNESQPTFAMKCLRPQIRSDPDEFTIGAEDLVHETAILANLHHPNIIKLHSRASGNLKNAFMLNDGYFILLDRLSETLNDRIHGWKENHECTLQGPATAQLEVAHDVANAMCYLHSKRIVFRDLKPANVGFDSNGVLKLFDFGFASGLPEKDKSNPSGFLYERCGTPRYMAPEVGFSLGYSLPSDVYSFGILLWQIYALEMPFSSITSPAEFDRAVFMEGERPMIDNRWPVTAKELMSNCWCTNPSERPTMLDVKSILSPACSEKVDKKKSPMRAIRSRMIKAKKLSVTGW